MLLVVKQQSMQLVLPVLGDNMVGVHKQIITHFPPAHGQKSLHNPVIFAFSLWVTILPHVLCYLWFQQTVLWHFYIHVTVHR